MSNVGLQATGVTRKDEPVGGVPICFISTGMCGERSFMYGSNTGMSRTTLLVASS
jgi:hypothetical protein